MSLGHVRLFHDQALYLRPLRAYLRHVPQPRHLYPHLIEAGSDRTKVILASPPILDGEPLVSEAKPVLGAGLYVRVDARKHRDGE